MPINKQNASLAKPVEQPKMSVTDMVGSTDNNVVNNSVNKSYKAKPLDFKMVAAVVINGIGM